MKWNLKKKKEEAEAYKGPGLLLSMPLEQSAVMTTTRSRTNVVTDTRAEKKAVRDDKDHKKEIIR